MEDLQRIHEMREKLIGMGFTEEQVLELWKLALEVTDKIVKEAE